MNPALPALAVVALAGALLLLWLFVSAAFLLWGARLAGIERRSFGRAIGAILVGGIASFGIALACALWGMIHWGYRLRVQRSRRPLLLEGPTKRARPAPQEAASAEEIIAADELPDDHPHEGVLR